MTRVLKSPGSSLFSQMLLAPHNYVATSNNIFAIWANSTFYLKRRCWAKNCELCFAVGLKQKLMHRHEGTAVAKHWDKSTWWFYNIIEFVHSIFTVIQFLNIEPQWIQLLAMILSEIHVQHLSALYCLSFFSLLLAPPFSSHCSPIARDQSGEGLAVGVMAGLNWDPSRVQSALIVTPGKRVAETCESTPHPGACTRLQKGKQNTLRVEKCWSKRIGTKTAQEATFILFCWYGK